MPKDRNISKLIRNFILLYVFKFRLLFFFCQIIITRTENKVADIQLNKIRI